MFGLKKTKFVLAGSVGLFAATAAYAVTFSGSHLDNFHSESKTSDASISQSSSDLRDMTFTITSSKGSRAEIRRSSQNSGLQSMGGSFKLNSEASGADRLSIIQVLTVEAANSATGDSKPDEQLAIRKTGGTSGGKPQWEFYLVHTSDQPACTSFKFTRGQSLNIKMEYEKDKKPKFIIKQGSTERSCTSGTSYTVGKNRAGSSGRYYYGKLGVYATGSGQGSASVKWDNIYD